MIPGSYTMHNPTTGLPETHVTYEFFESERALTHSFLAGCEVLKVIDNKFKYLVSRECDFDVRIDLSGPNIPDPGEIVLLGARSLPLPGVYVLLNE